MALAGATFVLWLASAPPAIAQVFPFALPFMPDSTVGQTVDARIILRYNGDDASLTISAIDVYPACTASGDDCEGGVANAEAGVLDLAPGVATTGTGNGVTTNPGGNTTCTGAWSLMPDNPDPNLAKKWRFVPPGGEGTLAINETEDCTVSFSAMALRVPTTDVSGAPGVSTRINVGMTTSGTGSTREGGFNVYSVAEPTPAPSTTSSTTTTLPASAPVAVSPTSAQQTPTTSSAPPTTQAAGEQTTTTSPSGQSSSETTQPLAGTGSLAVELIALAAPLIVLGGIVVHRHQRLTEFLEEVQRGSG